MTDKPATFSWPAAPEAARSHVSTFATDEIAFNFDALLKPLTAWVRSNLSKRSLRGEQAGEKILASYNGPDHDRVTVHVGHGFRDDQQYRDSPNDPVQLLVHGILIAGYSQGVRAMIPRTVELAASRDRYRDLYGKFADEVCALRAENAALKARLGETSSR